MIYLTTPPLYSDDHKLDPDDIANGNAQDLEVEIEELSCSGSSDQSSTENSFIQRISAMNRRGSEPATDNEADPPTNAVTMGHTRNSSDSIAVLNNPNSLKRRGDSAESKTAAKRTQKPPPVQLPFVMERPTSARPADEPFQSMDSGNAVSVDGDGVRKRSLSQPHSVGHTESKMDDEVRGQ